MSILCSAQKDCKNNDGICAHELAIVLGVIFVSGVALAGHFVFNLY